ncbi:MAG: HAD family hydrolase [Methylobacteriaceae bacterium]|nr:HAD family hydrolase [Methylobacteriaceae bacterium]
MPPELGARHRGLPSANRAAVARYAEQDARAAAFLDRDGVLNVDMGFTHRPEDLRFTPTAVEAVRLLNAAGYFVIVVTNQSGIARGHYGVEDVERFHDQMLRTLSEQGARIDRFYYCPYHPDGTIPAFAIEHDTRKPGSGMLMQAMRDLPIRREGSFMIGDRQSDLDAAAAAGVPALLVETNACDLAASVRSMLAEHAFGEIG